MGFFRIHIFMYFRIECQFQDKILIKKHKKIAYENIGLKKLKCRSEIQVRVLVNTEMQNNPKKTFITVPVSLDISCQFLICQFCSKHCQLNMVYYNAISLFIIFICIFDIRLTFGDSSCINFGHCDCREFTKKVKRK